jgi:hypothetical protein
MPEPDKRPVAATIPFTTIAQEAPLGDEPAEPLYTLVVRADGWDELRGRLPGRAFEAGSQAGLSDHDLIVVAFAGMQDNSGHSVTIEGITREGDRLNISLAHTGPGPGEIVETASTLPYHLVSLDSKELGGSRPLGLTFLDRQGGILGQGNVSLP